MTVSCCYLPTSKSDFCLFVCFEFLQPEFKIGELYEFKLFRMNNNYLGLKALKKLLTAATLRWRKTGLEEQI